MSNDTPTPRTIAACELPFKDWEEKASQLQDEMQLMERELAAAKAEVDQLRAEVSALREDKARLDWLEKNRAAIRLDYVDWGIGSNFGTPLRTAIDAVRKGTT